MTELKFSPTMGRPPKLWKMFPMSLVYTFGLAVGVSFGSYMLWELGIVVYFEVPSLNPLLYWGLFISLIMVDLIFRGDKAWKFDSQFWMGKNVVRAGVKHNPQKRLIPKKVKPRKIGKQKGNPIENEFDLIAYVEYRLRGQIVGAHLVYAKDKYKLVFGWDVQPFPSSISPQEALSIAQRIRIGLKAVPVEETLTFRAGAWRNVPSLPKRSPDILKTILEYWEHDRTKTQVALGRRTEKTLVANATYTVGSTGEKAVDLFDSSVELMRSLSSVLSEWMSKEAIPSNLHKILSGGYSQGFRSSHRMLSGQLGLKVKPLTCDELWTLDYSRFNDGAIPRIPFKIIVDSTGTHIERFSDTHLISALFAKGAAKIAHKRHVQLPGRDLYVRGCVWDSKPFLSYSDDSEDDALAQLFFGSSAINDCPNPEFANSSSEVWDSEIVVQYTGQDQERIRKEAMKLEDEANFGRKLAKSTDDVTSRNLYKQNKTMEANSQLLDGGFGIRVAWMGFVYRKTPQECDEAINAFCDLSELKGYVVPENEYFPKLWKDSLPFSFYGLLSSPMIWNRQIEDFTGPCASFVPIISDSSVNKEGVEFHSEYGNSPFYVPTFPDDVVHHKITLGESGSGKSLRAIADVVDAYKKDIRTFIIDATQGQVATFKPVCDALGGSFFDSRKECFNLLQGVDFRGIDDPENRDYALDLLLDQWKATISSLAMGSRLSPDLKADYVDLTAMLLRAWFADDNIRQRYDKAYDGGFGSEGWQQIPTLRDFLDLATLDRLPSQAQTEKLEQLLEEYRSRLAAFIAGTAGDRISRPSTFDIDSPIVVCALGAINDMSEADVLPYISSVTSLTTSSALRFPKTSIKGDEASKLAKYDCFSSAFGGYFSGGRKQGITAELIGQDLQSLRRGLDSSKYTGNCKIWQIGRVTEEAADFLAQPGHDGGLGIPRDLLRLVDQSSPMPLRAEAYSRWILQAESRRVVARYSPSFFQLAISVNGDKEIQDRQKFLDRYPNDKIKGYVEYGKYIKSKTLDATVKI
jgi:hypothetical protein